MFWFLISSKRFENAIEWIRTNFNCYSIVDSGRLSNYLVEISSYSFNSCSSIKSALITISNVFAKS